MLVDINFPTEPLHPVLAALSGARTGVIGGPHQIRRARGVYEIGHFNFGMELGLKGHEESYPSLQVVDSLDHLHLVKTDDKGNIYVDVHDSGLQHAQLIRAVDYIGCYGVCDHWEQVTAVCAQLQDSCPDPYVMSVTKIEKRNEESPGGWRWHRWGEYIGVQDPQCKYIADEPHIDVVYCYHVYAIPGRLHHLVR